MFRQTMPCLQRNHPDQRIHKTVHNNFPKWVLRSLLMLPGWKVVGLGIFQRIKNNLNLTQETHAKTKHM